MSRTITGRRSALRRLLVCIAALIAVVVPCALAFAYWSTSGNGRAPLVSAMLNAPTSVSGAFTAGTGVRVSWTASSTSSAAVAPSGYYVTRIASGGATAAACGSSAASLVTTTSCTDTGVVDGTYTYQVTAVYHSWTATGSASGSVPVTNVVPGVTVNQATGQPDPVNVAPVTFTAVFSETVVDFAAGDVTIGGTAPGTKSVSISGSGTTYTISVTGMTGTGTVTASVPAGVVHDGNGSANSASTSTDNTVTYDITAPAAPAPTATASATSGNNPMFVPATAVTFSDSATDVASGVRSVAYYRCAGTGTCSAATGALIGSSTSGSSYQVVSAAPFAPADGTYTVVAVATDNAGNVTTSAGLSIALDSTSPTAPAPAANGNS